MFVFDALYLFFWFSVFVLECLCFCVHCTGTFFSLSSFYFLLHLLISCSTKHLDRASIEPNFHDLYLKFLDKVNSKALNKEIVKATYENCKVKSLFLFTFQLKVKMYWELKLMLGVQILFRFF